MAGRSRGGRIGKDKGREWMGSKGEGHRASSDVRLCCPPHNATGCRLSTPPMAKACLPHQRRCWRRRHSRGWTLLRHRPARPPEPTSRQTASRLLSMRSHTWVRPRCSTASYSCSIPDKMRSHTRSIGLHPTACRSQLEEILARNDADRTAKKDLHHSSK